MPVLTLSLLGPFAAALDKKPLYKFRTNKVQALLIYLAVESGQVHRRESLVTLLWPGLTQTSAQVNLRQTIYRLCQAIPKVSARDSDGLVPLISSSRQTVQINPDASVRLDVESFRQLIDDDSAQAAALYRGDFLADFSLYDSNLFEEWAETTREGLRRQALNALDKLTTTHIEQGAYDVAQTYAWRQLEIDDLRERAVRQLMITLDRAGRWNAALAQHQLYQQRLAQELGVEPSAETTVLYKQIQADALRETLKRRTLRKPDVAGNMPVFLLTDIEGSTRLWDTYRQSMLSALLRHNAILEEQITRHGGRILELRGDGVKAVFEGVNPLPCVLAIQREFDRADWGEIGEVRIRIGLHGVPTIRKGYDYFEEDHKYYGPVLNHTARIMDAGWGGQILVSEQVRNTFSLPPGASWQDFGLHTLKSLDEPHRIYGLLHPDLPYLSFPPLRTLTTRAEPEPEARLQPVHNLELQPTPFIGRETELAKLDVLIDDPDVRLVTIVGPGGMGKTRLALATAERQILRPSANGRPSTGDAGYLFPDGIYFVSLAPLVSSDYIIPTVARVLNAPLETGQNMDMLEWTEEAARTPQEQLFEYLHPKKMLIVMDNFEHLLDGAGIITDILRAAPAVRVLVTSRERLRVREEQVFPIQGLEFPDWEAPEEASEFTAIQLFLQSARRAQPDFELGPGDMIYLTRICRLVGGMPLALELAASWVDMLSLEDIASEIQQSPDFLETDVRNVPERHRSIRAVFDYSWQRLDESERRIFSQFAIFRGGFTRVAAQKVTGATIRTLATFVSKSLLQYNQTTDRYQVHELLRQYGAEKLAADPDGEVAVRGRHSAYYCAELQRREAVFRSGRTQKAIAEIDLNIANIRTAWNWAITQGDVVRIDQALDGLCGFYDWSGHLQDGIAVCRAAIDRLIALDPASPLVTKRVNAQGLIQRVLSRAFANQAEFNSRLGFLDLAAPLLEQSVALVEDLTAAGLDARREKAIALAIQGTLAYQSDNPETARQHLKDSLSLSRAIGDHWSVLNTLNQLGFIARAVGNYHKAKQWYEEALSLARGQQNQWGEVNALLGLGWVARNMVAYDEARRLFEQSLVLSQSQGDKRSTAHAVEYLGYLALFQGCFEEASQRLQQSISLSLEIGFRPGLVFTLSNLGVTQWLNGAFEGAYQSIQESLATARELEQPHLLIWPTICHAELHACAGRYAEAHEQAQLAYAWAQQMYATPFVNGRIHRVLGWIALAAEKHEEACAQFQKSVDLYRVIVDDEQTAWSLAGAGCAAIGLGNLDEAQEYLTDALWTAIEIRAFIPLLFAVPVVALLLSVRGETERAFRVYRQACRFPLVANSGLFADLVGRHLPDIIDSPPAEDASQETDHRGALWATGAQLLAKWFQQWII